MESREAARVLLARARKLGGLTQQELADRAGVTQPTVAAYETGRRQPTLPSFFRLLRAAGFEPTVELEPRGWRPLTIGEAAHGIRAALRRQDPSEALRWVAQLIADVEQTASLNRAELLEERPPSTGDPRWDAMLAGVAEDLCSRHGLPVPSWTADPDRFLGTSWFLIETILGRPSPGLAASASMTTPVALADRNVFIDEASLGSA